LRQDNVIYFITFRLADSLPERRIHEIRTDRDRWLRDNPPPHTAEQARALRELWTVRIENMLDAGHGRCELGRADCRSTLETTMRHDDGIAYRLGAFVVMPNHVHALVQMLKGHDLSAAVKAWKSISARQINRLVGRQGSLWLEEYFDHIVRDATAIDRFTTYVRENPRSLPAGTFTLGNGSLHVT